MNFDFRDNLNDVLNEVEFWDPVVVERTIGDHTDYDVWEMGDLEDMMSDSGIWDYTHLVLHYFEQVKRRKCTISIWLADYNKETKTLERRYEWDLAYGSGTYRKCMFNGKITFS